MDDKIQIGKDCIKLIINKLGGESFSDYCDDLIKMHQKYPIPGHETPLTQFQLKNYHRIEEVHKDEATGILYLDHLSPWNFDEAAQMYYWHGKENYNKQIDFDGKMASAHDYPEGWGEY